MANCVILLLGALFSFLSALCFPALTLLFGRVFKEFIDYNLAVKIVAENLTTHGYYCDLSNSTISEYFTLNSHQLLHTRIASLSFVSLAVCLLFFIFAALSRSLTSIATAQIGRRFRQDHFSALLRKTVGWFSDSAEWLSELPSALLLDGIQVIEVGVTFSVILVQKFTMIIASLVIAFIINWKLALVLSCLLPFLLMFSYFLVKGISFFAEKEQDALMFASSVAEESLQSIETVKLFEGEHKEMNRYIHYIVKANKESRKIVLLTVFMLGLLYFFILSFFTIGSWLGFRLMLLCECEASDIILVTSEIVIGAFSISELLPAIGDVITGFQSASLIKRIASNKKSKPNSSTNSNNGIILSDFKGGLEFCNVVFSYPATPNINTLNEMNFRINPGQMVAMVGQNEQYSISTMFRLIVGFYAPEDGLIQFDNIDIKDLNTTWLRDQIGLVLYNEMGLFEGSLAENIGYGSKDEVAMDDIVKAAKMANAHKFIAELPFGYTSMVGGADGGITLNQTQIVLVCLARALIRDPKILIVDLTDFKFDKEAEKLIIGGIKKARVGRTTIIVPHKLSAIQKSADFILVIDNGRVAEVGSHDTLMINNQLYKDLYTDRASKNDFYDLMEDELRDNEFNNNRIVNGITNGTHGIVKEETHEDSPLLPKFNLKQNVTEDDRPTRTALSLYREILGIVLSKTHWYLLSLAVFLFVLAGAALSSFFILFEKLGEHFNNTDVTEIAHVSNLYSPLFSILGMIVMVLNCIGYIVLNCCEENLRIGIGKKAFSGLLSQKLKWFLKQNNSVDRLSKILSTDANKVSEILSIRVGSIAWSITAVLGALVASFILCWPIGLTLLPSYIWLLIAGYMHCKFTKHYSDYRNSLLIKSTKLATGVIRNVHTVLYFGMTEVFVRKYQESLKEPFRCDMKHAVILGVIYGMSQMLVFLFIGFGYLIGTFLILSSAFTFTYSDILTSLFTIWFASLIFKGRFDVFPGLQDGAISSRKILKYFPNYTNPLKDEKTKRLPSKAQYSLQLVNIWDEQSNETSVQPSLLSVDAGQTLAVTSPDMPRDKSVLSIIDQIDSPIPNTLLLDGVDICELDLKWVWRQIGFVSRYPVLFNISVMDNIRYGVNYKYISREEVVQVARAAGVHDVLQSLPMGYDTVVGFNGYTLTMEQRLSVALARALIRNPKVLLMDDTPLGLDNHIVEALERSRKGRTSLVITDKLSTLQQADSVVVLYKGKVLEQGSHSELMEKKKAYYVMKEILQKV